MISRALFTVIVVLCASGLTVGHAAAQVPEASAALAVTQGAAIGQRAELVVRVVNSVGEPQEGQNVTFLADMEFLNAFGAVSIGEAVTDEAGVARAYYVPRTSGEIAVTAVIGDAENGELLRTDGTLQVAPGPPVYEVESPIRIPGANVWLVVGALTTVWSVYLWVMWLLWIVSSEQKGEEFVGGLR